MSLEQVRLLARRLTSARSAAGLWLHLRAADIAPGAVTDGADWVAWKAQYWELRSVLLR